MHPETSGKILDMILSLGQWLHARRIYSEDHLEPDMEAYRQEVLKTQQIREIAELLTDEEVKFLTKDLDQMKQFIVDEGVRRGMQEF